MKGPRIKRKKRLTRGATARRSERGHPNRLLAGAVVIFLAIIVWIAFGRAVGYGFVDYDDNVYVYANPKITRGLTPGSIQWAFTHVHADNWHPLTTISHMLDCQLYGLHPWGHHLDSILLHASAAILLFFALRQLTNGNRTANIWPSAFVATVFAIHPLRVESVVWIAERKDVLSGVFFMLTLWAYARFVQSERPLTGRYGLALVFFALGLMCKPSLVTVPFVLLLLDYWPLGRIRRSAVGSQKLFVRGGSRLQQAKATSPKGTSWLALVVEKIPFLVLAAASCVATILAQEHALTGMREYPLAERIANALISYVAYLKEMIYPADLTVWYPYRHGNLSIAEVTLALLVLLTVSAIFLLLRRRRPYLLVGWLWFLAMLVPMLGIVQVGQQPRADRYTYLPMIGLCMAATWGVGEIFSKWRCGRAILAVAALVVIIALIIGSYGQTSYWRNTQVLWEHAIESTPDNYMAHYNLANVLAKKGRLDEAIAQYEKSIQIRPDYAQAHYNLGYAFASEGKYNEAIAACEEAVRVRPDFVEAHINLGFYLGRVGRTDEALNHFAEALRINPNSAEAHLTLARLLAQLGGQEEAEAHLAEGMRLQEAMRSPNHD